MSPQQRTTNYLECELSLILKRAGISASIRKKLANKLVEHAIEFRANKSARKLITVKDRGKKEPPEVIHYKPIAAAGFVASLVGGVLGASSLVLLGCAVVGCGASLNGIRGQVSPAEGALFWLICNSDDNSASRNDARRLFNDACENCEGITTEDFVPALQSLVRLGFVKESDGRFKVMERVYRLNTAHIFEI